MQKACLRIQWHYAPNELDLRDRLVISADVDEKRRAAGTRGNMCGRTRNCPVVKFNRTIVIALLSLDLTLHISDVGIGRVDGCGLVGERLRVVGATTCQHDPRPRKPGRGQLGVRVDGGRKRAIRFVELAQCEMRAPTEVVQIAGQRWGGLRIRQLKEDFLVFALKK